jgi:hypothetical protein
MDLAREVDELIAFELDDQGATTVAAVLLVVSRHFARVTPQQD